MSVFKKASALTTSEPGLYSFTTLGAVSADIAYGTFPDDSKVVLLHGLHDRGSIIEGPDQVATYLIPTTDPNTNATFDNSYKTFELDSGVHAVFYTQSAHKTYGPTDQTKLQLQEFDDDGNQILDPTTLTLNGKSAIKDLHSVSESAKADFGNSFTVAYSTFNPSTGKGQVAFEQFDDSRIPVNGGVIQTFNDQSPHGLAFSTFYSSDAAVPSYLLEYPDTGENIHVALYSPDMTELVSNTITVAGPDGEISTAIDRESFLQPDLGKNNFAMLSQTFEYQDSSGSTHEEIALETVNPQTLQLKTSTEFEVLNGSHTSVALQHLDNGNIVAAYNDGGQTYLKEFNKNLQQIGHAFAIPHDNGGFDSMINAGGNSVQVFWRDFLDPDNSNISVQHSQIFKV